MRTSHPVSLLAFAAVVFAPSAFAQSPTPDTPPPVASAPSASAPTASVPTTPPATTPPPTTPPAPVEDDGTRIVGGHDAREGTAPWQAEIYSTYVYTKEDVAQDVALAPGDPAKLYLDQKAPWERAHRCGGAYIGDMWVLTAAHCVLEVDGDVLKARRVRLGTQELPGGATYRIERAVAHKDYETVHHANDIALIKIARDAQTGRAGLPPTVQAIRVLGDGAGRPLADFDHVQVTGWGRTLARDDVPGALARDGKTVNHGSPTLKALPLTVFPVARCNAVSTYAGTPFDLAICAGSDRAGEDSCNGDSGGPLTRAQGNDRVLVGLVSWGKGCGLAGVPGIYTRMPAYAAWIKAAQANAQPGMVSRK